MNVKLIDFSSLAKVSFFDFITDVMFFLEVFLSPVMSSKEGVSLIEGLNPDLGDSQSTRENYIIDNTDIASWCAEFMGVDLDELSKELFVNVSSIGKYNSLTKQFVFNNGDKYI